MRKTLMEFMGFKVSVLIAVLLGGLFRIVRVKSEAVSFWGRFWDKSIVFVLSIVCGLLLLEPVMLFFSIPIGYTVVTAMIIALTSEILVSKILEFVRRFNLAGYLKDFFKIK